MWIVFLTRCTQLYSVLHKRGTRSKNGTICFTVNKIQVTYGARWRGTRIRPSADHFVMPRFSPSTTRLWSLFHGKAIRIDRCEEWFLSLYLKLFHSPALTSNCYIDGINIQWVLWSLSLDPVSLSNLPGQVHFGDVLESKRRQRLDFCFLLCFHHNL